MPRWSPALLAALAFAACTPSAPKKASCGAGETANDDPPLCYKVPAGFKASGDAVKREGWFSAAYASDKASVSFIARDSSGYEAQWKSLEANSRASKAADVKTEDVAGGKGKLITYTTPEKDARAIISVLVHGAKSTIECEAEYHVAAPKPELLEVCKSIHEP